jgi:hypothetical protein
MSTFASITWGIVAGFTILEVVDSLVGYIESKVRTHRLNQILENLDDAWAELEYDLAQAKPARKKVTKRK